MARGVPGGAAGRAGRAVPEATARRDAAPSRHPACPRRRRVARPGCPSGLSEAVLVGLALVASASLTFNTFFVYLPNHLAAEYAVPLLRALAGALLGLVVMVAAAPALGRLSDRMGRKPLLAAATIGLLVLTLPVYLLVRRGGPVGLKLGYVTLGALRAASCRRRSSPSCSPPGCAPAVLPADPAGLRAGRRSRARRHLGGGARSGQGGPTGRPDRRLHHHRRP